jgi:hypothetical protein
MFKLLKSLLVSLLFSFASPLFLIGMLLLILNALERVPSLSYSIAEANKNILSFLAIFGNGFSVLGVLVIGLACALVGGFLELFNIFQQGIKFQNYSKKM